MQGSVWAPPKIDSQVRFTVSSPFGELISEITVKELGKQVREWKKPDKG